MSQPAQALIDRVQLRRPRCSKCGQPTQLARIEPAGEPDYDQRTFECVMCGHLDVAMVKFKLAAC